MREAGRAPLSLNLLRSLSYEGHELRRTGFVTGWRARRSSLAYQKEPYFAWFSINFFLLGLWSYEGHTSLSMFLCIPFI